jgi:polyribonucleotide nucleotidyltransferase
LTLSSNRKLLTLFSSQERIDGRSFDQVRPISIDISVLPCTHGSALFTRGRTQSLVSLTLGGGQDEQRVEGIMEDEAKNLSFMLHYNFPPFSVGEVRPMRGPGRREVGHGHLAASALIPALPSREVFSYTIRLVSDILEADGSSSMATVCGSTMALMDGGVPIKEMIGGIAMGLLRNEKGDCIVLSDISGFEDAFGLMDFKVTGTDHKITAIQMDIKDHGGLSRQIFESALQQARRGRNHILDEMRKVLDKPKRELSTLVPRLVTFKIPSGKIGAVIGGGGKTIREIIETTGTNIDIESDGTVKILGGLEADLDKAVKWVKTLGGQIERGAIYKGPIRRIVDFGLFVELVPGQDGLVHVSNIPKSKQRSFARDYAVDEVVTVEVVEYDPSTERVRLRLLEE